jgi:hypothetical protein
MGSEPHILFRPLRREAWFFNSHSQVTDYVNRDHISGTLSSYTLNCVTQLKEGLSEMIKEENVTLLRRMYPELFWQQASEVI